MANPDILCNFKNCRKVLKKAAWVTSCSHIFCEDDGLKELRGPECKCPVCGTALSHSMDIVKADLNPSEHFKSMVLTGLSPDVIIDIVNRAFAFWTYQSNLARKNQEVMIMSYKEKLNMLETSYEALLSKIRQESAMMRKKVEELENDRTHLLARLDDAIDKLAEKNRENQKLHNACNTIRMANLQSFGDGSQGRAEETNFFGPKTMNDLLPSQSPRREMPPPTSFTPKKSFQQSATAFRQNVNQVGFQFNPVTPRGVPINRLAEDRVDFSTFPMRKTPRMD